ncbi:tetratricopeptide repeat protein [Verrucomicrobiota bacterium sgz303538]
MRVSILPRAFLTAVAALALCTSVFAESVDELIAKGDAADKQLRAAEALKYYLPAEKQQPTNARLLASMARQYRHLMADAESKSEKLRLGRIALGYSERAAALAPNDSDAQLSIAISLGKMLPILETKEQIEASPRIKASAEKAIRLNPRNDLAWHILGRWHRVVADVSAVKRALAPLIYGSLPKGSNEEALKYLQKAVELNPNRLIHYVELGRVYAQMGRVEEARRYINKGLAMPEVEKDDAEAKLRGRETLAKLR